MDLAFTLVLGLILGALATWHQHIGGWGTGGRIFLLPFVIAAGIAWLLALLGWLGEKLK